MNKIDLNKIKGIGWNIIGIIITLILLGLFVNKMIKIPYMPPIALGAFIILLIGVLLGLLFMFSAGFHNLNMSDQSKALGMPEGSIRAVIAMSLIVIFVGIGIFIFHKVSVSQYEITVEGMTMNEKTIDKVVKLTEGFTDLNISEVSSNAPTANEANIRIKKAASNIFSIANATTIPGGSGLQAEEADKPEVGDGKIEQASGGSGLQAEKADKPEVGDGKIEQASGGSGLQAEEVAETKNPSKFTLTIGQKPVDDSAIQLAQQLISILGTLVVAIAGFYFGTKSVSVDHGVTVSTLPLIRNMIPKEKVKGTDGDKVKATISGKNFASPQLVKLVLGSKEIMGEEIFSNSTSIICNFNIKDKLEGRYDLVVMNQNGGEDRLTEAFEVMKKTSGVETDPSSN